MKRLKGAVILASFLILLICVYSFLLGNKVFEGGFENEYAAWYFLAKGLFSSIALYLLVSVLEVLKEKR
ncbi:MAG TPA: hypothetical protein P5287_06705 [bacterium]|nr:hypothetical protein [bacterium]